MAGKNEVILLSEEKPGKQLKFINVLKIKILVKVLIVEMVFPEDKALHNFLSTKQHTG